MVSSIEPFGMKLARELFPSAIATFEMNLEDLESVFISGVYLKTITLEQALSHENLIVREAALKIYQRESSVITKNS